MSSSTKATELPPTTRRQLERLSAAPQLGLRLFIKMNGESELREAVLVNFSSTGASLRLPFCQVAPFGIEEIVFKLGRKVIASVVQPRSVWWNSDSQTIGVSFTVGMRAEGLRRRNRVRLKDSTRFHASLVASDPFISAESLYFRILDISKEGLSLECSKRNKYLLPGMQLQNCMLVFPGVSQDRATYRIRHVTVGADSMNIGAQLESANEDFAESLTRISLMLNDHPADEQIKKIFEDLQEAGFGVRRISRACKVDIVESAEDYQKVLMLRYRAYMAAGKLNQSLRPEEMGDEFDERALIIALRLNNRILATVRMVRCINQGDVFPFEESVQLPGLDWVRRRAACELSRLAVDPDIKGSDLAGAIMTRICDFSLRAGFKELFCFSTEKLFPVYKRFGFVDSGVHTVHPVLVNQKMSLMIGDPVKISSGAAVPALLWEALFKDVVLNLRESGVFDELPNHLLHSARLKFEKTVLQLNSKLQRIRSR